MTETTSRPPAGGRWSSRVRSVTLDLTPLRRSPEYRRLLSGQAISLIGSQMTAVAIPFQVFSLTGSSFAVGLLGLAALVPVIVFSLIGGAIADAVDRRRMLLVTQVGLATCSLLLFWQSAAGSRQVWPLYLLTAGIAGLFSLDSPARGAMIPRLVGTDQLPAAAALSQLLFNVSWIGGPLLGGVVIGQLGLRWAYGLDVLTFLGAIAAVASLPSMRPAGGGTRAGVASVLEGLRFLRGRPVLLSTFVVDLNAMVFGMPRALFPELAVRHFNAGPRGLGLLYAATAAGGLIAALFSGGLGRVQRHGRAVLLAVTAWGLAILGFGLTHTLWLGMVLLAAAGAADMVSAVFRTAILQAATPDALRGRLQGVHLCVVTGGPRLGDLESGAVAGLAGAQFSVVSGGLACLVGVVLLAAVVPAFDRYDAREPTA